MNDLFQENKRILIGLVIVLFLGAFALYYFLVLPEKEKLDAAEKAINTLENDKLYITTMINNLKNEEPEVDGEELILKNRIPKERNLDEYILSLLELETVTNSDILSVTFAYDSGTEHIEVGKEEETDEVAPENIESDESGEPTEPTEPVEPVEPDVDNAEGAMDETAEGEEAPIVIDPVIVAEKPESLEVLVVRITARSPNYDEYLLLLETIERQERISIVSNLTFKNPAEEEKFFSDHKLDEEMIEFTAELTTFYYPER